MENEDELIETETKIVYLANPLSEDFTHSFDGCPLTIPARETVPLTEPEAKLFSTHIASKELGLNVSSEARRARATELISDEPPESEEIDEETDELLGCLEGILNSIERFCMICAGSLVWAQGCEDVECDLNEYRPEPEEEEE